MHHKVPEPHTARIGGKSFPVSKIGSTPTSPCEGAVTTPDPAEFLADCADVLASPRYNTEHLDKHAAGLDELIQRGGGLPPDVVVAMKSAKHLIGKLRSGGPFAFFSINLKRLGGLSETLLTSAMDLAWRPLHLPRDGVRRVAADLPGRTDARSGAGVAWQGPCGAVRRSRLLRGGAGGRPPTSPASPVPAREAPGTGKSPHVPPRTASAWCDGRFRWLAPTCSFRPFMDCRAGAHWPR